MENTPNPRRERPASRWLLISPRNEVLLFRFAIEHGPLQGQDFWSTPGGALEPGETYAQAAVRELREETGIDLAEPGPPAFRREVVFQMPDGDYVHADERYFVYRASDRSIRRDDWTAYERQIMKDHRWWSAAELDATQATFFPEDLPALLRSIVGSSA
ncbi:MAG: NUDIX domain-containing protein [Curvibacter sp.]|nr:NUDIX domain-containing protein [Curvibacter sp.]